MALGCLCGFSADRARFLCMFFASCTGRPARRQPTGGGAGPGRDGRRGTRSLAYGRGCGQRRTGSSAAGKVARTAGSAAAMASSWSGHGGYRSWSLHLCIFASCIGRSTRRDGLRRDDELRRDLISSSSYDSKQAQSLSLDARRDRGDAIDLMPTWGLTSVGARETKDGGNFVQNGVEGC